MGICAQKMVRASLRRTPTQEKGESKDWEGGGESEPRVGEL